jgi:hypothetical protein
VLGSVRGKNLCVKVVAFWQFRALMRIRLACKYKSDYSGASQSNTTYSAAYGLTSDGATFLIRGELSDKSSLLVY